MSSKKILISNFLLKKEKRWKCKHNIMSFVLKGETQNEKMS